MKLTTLLCGSALAVAFACGGRTYYGVGDGGTSDGTGGYLATGGHFAMGGHPSTGGYAPTGGSPSTGANDWPYTESGGYYLAGGSPSTGANDWPYTESGGYVSTGGGPCCGPPGPVWAYPFVEPICDGITAPPAAAKWVDDFEGGAGVFDPLLVPYGWFVESDVEETITGGLGPALATSLAVWGSHDPSSTSGMQMQGFVSQSPVGGKNSWGASWDYETTRTGTAGKRASLNMSAYTGMVIWARLAGTPGKGNMAVTFPTPQTTIAELGGDGTCGGDAGTDAACYAYYQAPGKVTKTCWSPVNISFGNLKVPYGNTPAGGFDKAHVFGVELQFGAWATAIKANWPVDVIVDDMYLY
jgi:hypothetical protein